MEYRKTCLNCNHYHSILEDTGKESFFHIHDYCDVWKTEIPDCAIFDRNEFECGYTDIESGVTECHAFEPRKDEKFVFEFPELGQALN